MASQGIGPVYSLYWSTAEVVNDGSALTTLNSYVVGARVFARNGDSVSFDYAGSCADAAANCRLVLYFNGAAIVDHTFTVATTGDAANFHLFGRLIRTGPSTQMAVATLDYGPNKSISFVASLSKDDTTSLALELLGEQDDAASITCNLAHLTFQAGPS